MQSLIMQNDWFEPMECHSGLVSCMAWHPDGQCLASGGHDGQLKIWDIGNRSPATPESPTGPASPVSPDSAGGAGSPVAPGSACVRRISAHAGPIWSMAWAAHVGFLASGGSDACVKIWDLSADPPKSEEVDQEATSEEAPLFTLSLSRNNAALFIYAVAWAPHTELLSAGSSDGRVRTWKMHRPANGQAQLTSLRNFGGLASVRSLSWSPCGEQLAYAGSAAITCVHLSPEHEGEDAHRFGQSMSWYSVSWCPDKIRNFLAAGNSVGELVVFRTEDGSVIFRSSHSSAVLVVAWSPYAKQIVAGSRDGSVRIFDTSEASFSGPRDVLDKGNRFFPASQPKKEGDEIDELASLAWAPEGRRIALGYGSGKVEFQRPPGGIVGTSRCRKEEMQDKFAVLLCEWNCSSQANKSFPALFCEGRLVTSSKLEWRKFPEFGLASSVAVVTVDFDCSAMVEQDEAPMIPQSSTCTCSLGAIRSAMAGHTNKSRKRCRTVYFVFRGSVDVHNWIHNLNIQLNKQAYKSHGVNVHSSFLLEIENRNFLELAEFRESLSNAAREGADLIFTGHSQGGAHATILFADLNLRQSTLLHQYLGSSQSSTRRMLEHARLVAFAAPTVFAREGRPSKEFCRVMLRGRNYIMRNDPVPRSYSGVPDWAPKMIKLLKSSAVSTILPMLPWVVRPSEAEVNDHLDSMDINRLLDVVNIAAVEAVARSYFHAMEMVVIAGEDRDWDEFDVTPASFSDHDIKVYADFLFLSDIQRQTRFPAPNY